MGCIDRAMLSLTTRITRMSRYPVSTAIILNVATCTKPLELSCCFFHSLVPARPQWVRPLLDYRHRSGCCRMLMRSTDQALNSKTMQSCLQGLIVSFTIRVPLQMLLAKNSAVTETEGVGRPSFSLNLGTYCIVVSDELIKVPSSGGGGRIPVLGLQSA